MARWLDGGRAGAHPIRGLPSPQRTPRAYHFKCQGRPPAPPGMEVPQAVLSGRACRSVYRSGALGAVPTTGHGAGLLQANVVILPARLAE